MSDVAVLMPKYRCHKEVWALKISHVIPDGQGEDRETDGSGVLLFEGERGYGPRNVSAEYMRKHKPVVGGYFVQYEDGYESFSPAQAFEAGYTLIRSPHTRRWRREVGGMGNQMQLRRALRPDAQAFDEVRIVTVPRYKTSGLSGDEWRISAKIELLRKGKVIVEKSCRDVQVAAQLLPGLILQSIDDAKGYYAGVDDVCDQEGCSEKGTVKLLCLKEFSRDDPHHWNRPDGTRYRLFCDRHAKRGDCGMDDADTNYKTISGGTVRQVRDEDISRSGVVVMDPSTMA